MSEAACSGSSGADDGLAPAVSLDSSTTTAPSTTTTTVATTTSSSSTTSSTPTPTVPGGKPDLEIPTEWESDLDEIYGRYLLYWDALGIAMGPPAPDPDYPPLAELAEAALYEELQGQIEERRDSGRVVLEGPDTDHGLRLPNPAVLTKTEGNEVIIQDCFIDGRIVQTLDGEILDDSVVPKLTNVNLKVIDGEWRVPAVVEALPESSGYQECKDYEQLG